MYDVQPVALHDATRERYLTYALSVITSRALPDVRDGLKPVQRRILYTMFHELALHPGGRYRKSAAVVGDVMGKYHPHGDQSIYDALVRMAQDFSLRAPLIDPHGNFGSLDGDPPAAFRYTECKLKPLAEELLQEIKKDTVDFRPTYDGQRDEPVVLPAQFPQLLVNGSEGIAVGMATRIPPHHLGEVIDACVAMIDGEAHTVSDLMHHIKGPDFPTGGEILNDRASLVELYEKGQGSVRMRGTWRTEKDGRRKLIVIDSIPYAQNKAKLIERIGADVAAKKLPQVLDVRDESTDIVRIVLELKQGASPEAVMAYLYKRTPLEGTFPVQINALVPAENADHAVPQRLDLYTLLDMWLGFRYETVRRRYEYDLRKLKERIHILEGFAMIFADLDEAIRLIRESEGKRDAANKLIEAFGLSEIQAEAILELRLYKLARLEIAAILDELDEKRALAFEIEELLASETLMWGRIRSELIEIRNLYSDPRRTLIGEPTEELEFDSTAYIVREDTFVVVTKDGWVKRQSSFSDVDRIRVKEHDEVRWLLRTDTSRNVAFFTSAGVAFTLRADEVPATSGYGKPIQSFFNFPDGAQLVGVIPAEPSYLKELPPPEQLPTDEEPPPYVVSVSAGGRVQRLTLSQFLDTSTKSGRKFARLGKGDAIIAAYASGGSEHIAVAADDGHVLVFDVMEANLLRAAGKGTMAIKLVKGAKVFAFELAEKNGDGPEVHTTGGRALTVNARKFAGKRAGKGHLVLRRGGLENWTRGPQLFLGDAKGGDK